MAFADFGKVAQIDAKSGEDYRLRGMAFVLKGEDDHAIAEYSRWMFSGSDLWIWVAAIAA